jgi:hypothetical protein
MHNPESKVGFEVQSPLRDLFELKGKTCSLIPEVLNSQTYLAIFDNTRLLLFEPVQGQDDPLVKLLESKFR